jgi:hypothetical protein
MYRVHIYTNRPSPIPYQYRLYLTPTHTRCSSGDFNQREEDINFLPAILISLQSTVLRCECGVYALMFSCVSEIHRLMASKGAEIGADGTIANADTIEEDGTTYVVVKEEYRRHVGADRIRRLGPADLYEIAFDEIFPFLRRAQANPAILGNRNGWRQCYKSMVAIQYGRLNEAMHGVGGKRGGLDINGSKTALSFWQEADERWKLEAPNIVQEEEFIEMAKVCGV